MDLRKFVLKESAFLACGQLLCVSAMIGIFALLGHFDRSVLLGGIFGGILAVLNFFVMAVMASAAADKAENQDVKGGQLLVRLSYILRMGVLFVILFALIYSKLCHPLAAVLPLVLNQPILYIGEFFRKSGETKT